MPSLFRFAGAQSISRIFGLAWWFFVNTYQPYLAQVGFDDAMLDSDWLVLHQSAPKS